ncbi:MAG TPA: low molecular weight phosphatase family protein, partial [Pseudolabrys sp.]|nr:low molecular weight phosphatase family protein [Pseudolabrys sp.]
GVAPGGELDPFAVAAMAEIGIDISQHKPMSFEEYEDLEGLNVDVIVSLTPGAHHKAIELAHRVPAKVEYWPTPDPTGTEGNREQRLDAYRGLREELMAHIRQRFGGMDSGNE